MLVDRTALVIHHWLGRKDRQLQVATPLICGIQFFSWTLGPRTEHAPIGQAAL